MREAQQKQEQILRLDDNLANVAVDTRMLKRHLPKRRQPIMDFAKRYTGDLAYKAIVIEQLGTIIENDVVSMSLNPVFGVLWRAACNDRDNPARDKLITSFGLHVERMANADEKKRMTSWLEESYDYATEIMETLDAVPEHQRFPCVFLDPTIDFASARESGEQDGDEDKDHDRPVTAFRRDELLEIGRSCDGRVLRRLGKVLTRITYVESVAELPTHMAATSNTEVARIPTSLASKEHGWKFWKILLHVVLPGTMLSARPAVVLAALAIKIGLKPLFDSACAAMLFWRDKWCDHEVPETWNSSCLGLLLDADAEHRKQHIHDDSRASNGGLLLEADRELFTRLVDYQHAGANLMTTLTAEVGWRPQKTRASVGLLIVCRACKFPRSVTIVAEGSGGKCGLCVRSVWDSAEHRNRAISTNVTTGDTTTTKIAWVECSIQTCRAHYVCYNTADLNVRAKCWYCRMQTSLLPQKRCNNPAPTLECIKCLSKVIWPKQWRHMVTEPFSCTACVDGTKTIVGVDTSADQICEENGRNWLLQNKNNALEEPFKRTLFKTITTTGIESFLENVRVLPELNPGQVITLNGKHIRNMPTLVANLRAWINRRVAERSHCSLCFDLLSKTRLLPACRRRGCHQSFCEACLRGWYGLNSAGTIVNTAALFCPFCRRPPAARTLAAYGKGVHAVGNLKVAYDERGSWIHAWCYECGKAQRLMERECARGAPEALQKWTCDDCKDSALERALLVEEMARLEVERAARLDERRRAEVEQELRRAQAVRRKLECPVKECPGCKAPTQKTYGCDHMTCPCRTHWCWACGVAGVPSNDIYNHMNKVHGGFYEGGEGLGFEDEDDDDY